MKTSCVRAFYQGKINITIKTMLICVLLTFFITSIITRSFAQTEQHKKFKLDFMLGQPLELGFTGSLEPQFHLNERFTIGAEYQLALILSSSQPFNETANGKTYQVQGEGQYFKYLTSYSLTTDYYLKGKYWRPFFGLGAGINLRADDGLPFYTKPVTSQFSGFPRFGIEYGHFRLLAAFYILSEHLSFTELKAGFFFGGGHIK